MKTILYPFFSIALSILLSLQAQAQAPLPQLGHASTQQVIDAMTNEEKALMVTGAKRREVVPTPLPGYPQKNIEGVGGYTYPFVHLGIPAVMLSDGPAGLRIAPRRYGDTSYYYCTAFPVANLVASSWDPDVAKAIGEAMGQEALAYGVDILLAPALNIHRNPLGGRNFEYYSEDPLISGTMAAAAIKGIQSQGVGTSVKHFAANNQETNRRTINTVLSERALREIYLKGFEIAIKEGKPWTVMSSYNKINGCYTSQSTELLEDLLRKEWGFDGFVLSDWYGGDNAVAQMKAGNDLLMPGLAAWSNSIDSALENGALAAEEVDRNIHRILDVIQLTPTFKNHPVTNKPDLKKHAELAREAAAESLVLLKNQGATLPLASRQKTALFGNYSYKLMVGGTGSGMVNNAYSVSLAQGLQTAGFVVDEDLANQYLSYLEKGKRKLDKRDSLITAMPKLDSILSELPISTQQIRKQAAASDVAIISIMRVFGEGGDRRRNDFYLTTAEQDLITRVSTAFHERGKKVVVVLNIGGVIETASWRNEVDAILLAWQPGQEGGHALADIISGRINPSGKLTTTFPLHYEDVPSAANFPGTPMENPSEVIYEEGIYVGYRYYDSYQVPTAYPFGHGLSYTRFAYDKPKLSAKSFTDTLQVSISLKNKGTVAGREVVQVYLRAPGKSMHKPTKELKAFAKTNLLAPGETQQVNIQLGPSALASFDSQTSAWEVEAGQYELYFGSSSQDIRAKVAFNVPKAFTVQRVKKLLAPRTEIAEWTGK
ncbi:glycoside hydrolase family 3 C-terminal domain-containing protein [Olivibacter sp. XZL3]|uniref:glycoside hydrolase family 3 C-terminal domain-containing protein n=1 Tax=Olivibacter sp. XZL3 TaxID=1735116 RepID=UPI0010650767|nr:glycoside hydrolase family 3 C-terminal domain-containing protein [Olivibacter sp. XZL3]